MEGRIGVDDTKRGLYEKFAVIRTDGSSCEGGKHYECEYFVLDLMHDPFALPALITYAMMCRKKYPALSKDLDKKIVEMQQRFSGCFPPAPEENSL